MPELPEVETIRLGLQKYLVGHTILNVEVKMPRIVQGDIQDVIGAKITGARRFGKGLVIDLGNGYCLAIHIKLTGQLVYQDPLHNPPAKIKVIKHTYDTLPSKSTHVIFELDKDAKLYYNDFRRFGWIKILPQKELQKVLFFKELGPEFPLVKQTSDKTFLTLELFKELVKKTKGPIKPLLLEQKKISGIGNIYANDGLFIAKIDPRRKANTLSDKEIETLFHSLEKVLKIGLENGGASELSYIDILGHEGKYQLHFQVYGREGKPCHVCKTPIEKIMLTGRGTYFCPHCQK